jgi:hypothetical protein
MDKTFSKYVEILEYTKFIYLELGRFPTINEDKEKHIAHNDVCDEIRKNFNMIGYKGDLNDRQEMAKFACLYEGRKDLIKWAN